MSAPVLVLLGYDRQSFEDSGPIRIALLPSAHELRRDTAALLGVGSQVESNGGLGGLRFLPMRLLKGDNRRNNRYLEPKSGNCCVPVLRVKRGGHCTHQQKQQS